MSDCKCRPHVIISDTGIIDARIEYCPKHKAAPELYEALVMLVSSAGAVGWMMADDALALADGDV